MSLKEKLQQDWKNALKDGDKLKAQTISLARTSILISEKSGCGEVDDQKVIEILTKEVKQRHEAIEEFKKGHRQDLIDEANSEIKILVNYLPQQLPEEDIIKIIKATIAEVGANSMKDFGKVMKLAMPKVKGKADGNVVSKIVKQYLNK